MFTPIPRDKAAGAWSWLHLHLVAKLMRVFMRCVRTTLHKLYLTENTTRLCYKDLSVNAVQHTNCFLFWDSYERDTNLSKPKILLLLCFPGVMFPHLRRVWGEHKQWKDNVENPHIWDDNIKDNLIQIVLEGVYQIHLAQNKDSWKITPCFWRNSPQWSRVSAFTRFLDHTQRHTTVGRTPPDEWSARRGDLYLTIHNTPNRHSCPLWDSKSQSQQASGRRPTP
jgi:hypothetical protein